MKLTSAVARTILLAIFFTQIPELGKALELSESVLPITTQDSVAPATGTLMLLGLSDELPPGAQTVAGVHSPGNPVLHVRALLSAGEIFALTGVVEGGGPQPGGWGFCCITASGYTADTERLPGPDEFWPWIWNWFFDDPADPGLLAAGEIADLWVSFTTLDPGNRILFFASGPSPEPCSGETCQPFGTVTVLAGTVSLLDAPATLALVILICTIALGLGKRLA